jgi:hypothetical protein
MGGVMKLEHRLDITTIGTVIEQKIIQIVKKQERTVSHDIIDTDAPSIKEALIKLGWTPPKEVKDEDRS